MLLNKLKFSKQVFSLRFAHFRIPTSSLSKDDIPNDYMRNFVASFAALTEASEIFILDGTDKNRDILCDLALDEPTTNESPMLAARQTLHKHGENWEIGTKVLTEEEKNDAFRGIMKGKTLFFTPYYGVWNKAYGFRLSDSAYVSIIRCHGAEDVGSTVLWHLIPPSLTEFEIAIHSLDLNILPPLPNKENWEDIVMPPIETLEGKFELLKKEEARKKKFEEE